MRRTIRIVALESTQFVASIINECNEYRREYDNKFKCLTKVKQIKVVGYGFGVHVAAYFCRQLRDHLKQTVPILLGKIYEFKLIIFFVLFPKSNFNSFLLYFNE